MSDLQTFNQYRPLLFSIAYRMLGTVTDAEDMVQETFLRWQQTAEVTVNSAKTYLSTIVTRLCIDHLRSARVQREQYVGPWLPEPMLTQQTSDPADAVELADTLSTAFLMLMENLSPLERAVFLLREVFDYEYSDVGRMVDKNPTYCRQLVRRARQHLTSQRPRFEVSPQRQEQLVQQFLRACQQGDLQGLIRLLSEDITFCSDGGGKVPAALKPVQGAVKVARLLLNIRRHKPPSTRDYPVEINGQAGMLQFVDEQLSYVYTFDFAGDRIQTIYTQGNPEKLMLLRQKLVSEQHTSSTF
ncbi:MAG: RNA polymerase sigma-70 factor [Kaiparowitsia implicata GSE-PSE-MK54-09C]|jgi:RNA polymerase sigma-70 factor (ECF subfamily)|nr:RNA polymerase sigma-70 factor [Kaiparowitsia implicata GSE-PSE-MK54-09C]